jgi:solute carrier family 25 carnitine/acylcarnitine transporter 20/29
VFPLAVIKNRIQAAPDLAPPKYSGMAAAARDVWTSGGVRGFYTGFLPCILRAVPANAACFVAFEMIMNILPP